MVSGGEVSYYSIDGLKDLKRHRSDDSEKTSSDERRYAVNS